MLLCLRGSESGPGCLGLRKQVLQFLILTSSPQVLEFFLIFPIKVREMMPHSFITCLYLPAFGTL